MYEPPKLVQAIAQAHKNHLPTVGSSKILVGFIGLWLKYAKVALIRDFPLTFAVSNYRSLAIQPHRTGIERMATLGVVMVVKCLSEVSLYLPSRTVSDEVAHRIMLLQQAASTEIMTMKRPDLFSVILSCILGSCPSTGGSTIILYLVNLRKSMQMGAACRLSQRCWRMQ
jgi:hypothetical protein